MKKIVSIFTVLSLAIVAFGAVPAATDRVFESKIDTSYTTKDTLVGVDSTTVVSLRAVKEPGWNYLLCNRSITGGGNDSVACYVYLDSYNSSQVVLNRQIIDTLKTAYCSPIKIPLNLLTNASYYTLKLIGITSRNGGEVITNGFQIIKYRPVDYNR